MKLMPYSNQKDTEKREQQILVAAAEQITHYGYDKTSMSDIAEAAGVTRAIVYLHFDSKERLFEALLFRETRTYLQNWLAAMEASPGTIAAAFRSSLDAIRRSPFLKALMKQDRQVFGTYLRKSGNLFASLQSPSLWPETLRALQQAGAIRPEIQPEVVGHLMNALALGIMEMETGSGAGGTPSFDDLLAATADLLDRAFVPQDGGNPAAGKAILQRLAQTMQAQLERSQLQHDLRQG